MKVVLHLADFSARATPLDKSKLMLEKRVLCYTDVERKDLCEFRDFNAFCRGLPHPLSINSHA